MTSVNGETNVVMRGITRGACNYLIKPIRLEELRNLWQHVIRRRGRQYDPYVKLKNSHGDSSDIGRVADSPESTASEGDVVIKDIRGLKEARVNWTPQLHQQFLKAVNESRLHSKFSFFLSNIKQNTDSSEHRMKCKNFGDSFSWLDPLFLLLAIPYSKLPIVYPSSLSSSQYPNSISNQ